jgi:serine/threonine protein kinase
MVKLSCFFLLLLLALPAYAGRWVDLSKEIAEAVAQANCSQLSSEKRINYENYHQALLLYREKNAQSTQIPVTFKERLFNLIQNRADLGELGKDIEVIYEFVEHIETNKRNWKSQSNESASTSKFVLKSNQEVSVDFQLAPSSPFFEHGTQMGKREIFFQVENKTLGEGTFKKAFPAMWYRAGKKVVKLVLDPSRNDPNEIKNWENEKKVLYQISNLPSENKVGLPDTYGFLDRAFYQKYFSSDLVPFVYLPTDPNSLKVNPRLSFELDESERMNILVQIATGLNQLHSLGWVHSDLKPDNVLVNCTSQMQRYTNCTASLTDFGLSYLASDYLEGKKPERGSPNYYPPELLDGWIGSTDQDRVLNSQKGDLIGLAEIAYYLWMNRELSWSLGACNRYFSFGGYPFFLRCKGNELSKLIRADEKKTDYHSLDHLILRAMDPKVESRISSSQFLTGMKYVQNKYRNHSAPSGVSIHQLQQSLESLPGFSIYSVAAAKESLKLAGDGRYIVFPMGTGPSTRVAIAYKSRVTHQVVIRELDVVPDSLSQVSEELEFLKAIGTITYPKQVTELFESQAGSESER